MNPQSPQKHDTRNGKSVETEKDTDSTYVATLKVGFVYFNATNSNLIWAGSLIG